MTEAPKTIYLLLHEGDDGGHLWCENPDPTGRTEIKSVEYVRADLVAAKDAEITRLRATLELIQETDTHHHAIGDTLHKKLGPCAEIAAKVLESGLGQATPCPHYPGCGCTVEQCLRLED